MKNFWKIFYGLCVFWLILICTMYIAAIAFDGLKNINNYELDGGYLFITMISIMVVIVRYPLRAIVNNVVREIKRNFNKKTVNNKQANSKKKTA